MPPQAWLQARCPSCFRLCDISGTPWGNSITSGNSFHSDLIRFLAAIGHCNLTKCIYRRDSWILQKSCQNLCQRTVKMMKWWCFVYKNELQSDLCRKKNTILFHAITQKQTGTSSPYFTCGLTWWLKSCAAALKLSCVCRAGDVWSIPVSAVAASLPCIEIIGQTCEYVRNSTLFLVPNRHIAQVQHKLVGFAGIDL